jgi:acyl carrier protein
MENEFVYKEYFTRQEVEQGILQLIKQITGKEITLEDKFEDKEIDEVDIADLIVESEVKFNVRIDDEKLFEFKTAKDMVEYIYNIVKPEGNSQ